MNISQSRILQMALACLEDKKRALDFEIAEMRRRLEEKKVKSSSLGRARRIYKRSQLPKSVNGKIAQGEMPTESKSAVNYWLPRRRETSEVTRPVHFE